MEVPRYDGDPRAAGAPGLPPSTAPIGLSTGSVYPEPTAAAFRRAAELGYDGVEVFVWTDAVSQSADELDRLVQTYQIPVISVHSPCVIMTARVWGSDPLVKLGRSIDLAESLGASVVVTHPPFVWQRVAADNFGPAIAQMQSDTDVKIAVENMFPTTMGGQRASVYRPHWDPTIASGHAWYTIDLSHTATAQVDAQELLARMGRRLAHLHLADGTGSSLDEHLVPGRGGQPCAEVLETLAAHRFPGSIVVEIGTRRESPANREMMLAEALGFARLHFAAPAKS